MVVVALGMVLMIAQLFMLVLYGVGAIGLSWWVFWPAWLPSVVLLWALSFEMWWDILLGKYRVR